MTDQKKQIPSGLHDSEAMPDPQNKGRRTALRKLLVGAGALTTFQVLPTKWTKPIIDQIVLPAHAGTSGVSLNDPCSVALTKGTRSSSSVTVRVDGFVTPPTANLPTAVVATPTGAGSPVTVNTTTAADGTLGVTITISGGPGITSVGVVTKVTGADGSATCSVNVPNPSPQPTPSPSTTPAATTTTS